MDNQETTKRFNIRDLGKALNQMFTCPDCGKSTMVRATSHRGHGTGQRGASYYTPTSWEAVSADTHCTCPGGPVDQRTTQEAQP